VTAIPVQTSLFSYFEIQKDPRFTVITTGDELQKAEQFLAAQRVRAFDYETSGLRWWSGARICGAAWAARDPAEPEARAFYVPFRHQTGQHQLEDEKALAFCAGLLKDDATKVAHNLKFERHFSREDGLDLAGGFHDTQVMAKLHEEEELAGLDAVTQRMGSDEVSRWSKMLTIETTRIAKVAGLSKTELKERFGYSLICAHFLGQYACSDAFWTLKAYDHYQKLGIPDQFSRIYPTEIALTEVLADMEKVGVPLDREYLKQLHAKSEAEREQQVKAFFQEIGAEPINLASDDELRWLITQKLGLSIPKQTASGQDSVDKEVLGHLKKQCPPLARVLRIRELDKIVSTYTLSLIDLCDASGILHTDMQQLGTRTGRLSCRKPNLTNVTSDQMQLDEDGDPTEEIDPESIRCAFMVQRPDNLFGEPSVRIFLDFQQIELKVLAHYTQDPLLMHAYLNDLDIHDETEMAVFGTKKINRRYAKVLNFGISFCMSEIGFARNTGLSEEEAKKHMAVFYEKYRGISRFRDGFWRYVASQGGRFANMFGRARYLPWILSETFWQKKRAQRQAIATLIQGTAAELTKESLVRIYRFLKEHNLRSRITLVVHDEVQIDAPVSELLVVARNAKRLMELYPEFDPIPIRVSTKYSSETWAEVHQKKVAA
jgi:DNA polymerase-1